MRKGEEGAKVLGLAVRLSHAHNVDITHEPLVPSRHVSLTWRAAPSRVSPAQTSHR